MPRETLRALHDLGLEDGDIDMVVTDHSPSTGDLKRLDTGDFGTAWGGIASLQLGLPVVWDEARRRGIPLARVVRWMATHPADRVGLATKGRLAVGADADLVVFAPEEAWEVDVTRLKHKNPISAYADQHLVGRVRQTFLRGEQVAGRVGGEPDVIGFDKKSGEYIFMDCSEQSPDRRSICYDREGEQQRIKKGVHPGGNAVELAEKMGIELLSEEEYRQLQRLGEFDTTTSSWIKTPDEIRKLGGGLFCDRRYDHVFVYHNGANSFYSARGFRGKLRV